MIETGVCAVSRGVETAGCHAEFREVREAARCVDGADVQGGDE